MLTMLSTMEESELIGHEMSHGFDDQGRLFDKDGNMSDWWTAEDAEKFNAKSQVLVAQFDEVSMSRKFMGR